MLEVILMVVLTLISAIITTIEIKRDSDYAGLMLGITAVEIMFCLISITIV